MGRKAQKKEAVQYGVIESGKPMPSAGVFVYPWHKMKPGDRIAVPYKSYAALAKLFCQRNGIKATFAMRTIDGVAYVYRVS